MLGENLTRKKQETKLFEAHKSHSKPYVKER
jgi:hypothetical protein